MSCPHCPHCKNIPNSQSSSLGPFEEIALIETEITRLFDLTVKLNKDRVALLRRLNSCRSATRNLPFDVLSLIFQEAVLSIDTSSHPLRLPSKETHLSDHPIILGSVCSQWYYAAQSTPQLWASLDIDICHEKSAPAKLALLDLYLKNVKNVSFSLELSFDTERLPIDAVAHRDHDFKNDNRGGPELLAQFGNIIFRPENACRIRVLRMNEVLPAWVPLFFNNFPRLEELGFGFEFNGKSVVTHLLECKGPRLQRLIVKNASVILPFSPNQAPWLRNLTVVKLYRVTLSSCMTFLILCPNLIEFRARGCPTGWGTQVGHAPYLNKPLILPNLRVLEWTCFNRLRNARFLQYVRLPALHTLCWGGDHNAVDPVGLIAFFEALPPTLVELEIFGLKRDPDELGIVWEELLMPLVNVRKLSLYQCSSPNVIRILRGLRSGILPDLEEMQFVGRSEPTPNDDDSDSDSDEGTGYGNVVYGPKVRNGLRDMLEDRWGSVKSGRLQFSTWAHPLDWEPADGEWVRLMARGGLELEIFEDSYRLDYLYIPNDGDASVQ